MAAGAYIDYLKILHGSFNCIIALLFFYQAWLGLRIRKERRAGGHGNFTVIKRHRKQGPILAALGVAGYLAGIAIVSIDKGHLAEYPPHLAVGSAIALSILAAFLISRRIKGLETAWRTPHFMIGLLILFLYLVQIYLGLDILL